MKNQAEKLLRIFFLFLCVGLLATVFYLLTTEIQQFQQMAGKSTKDAMIFAWVSALLLSFVSALKIRPSDSSLAKNILKWAFVFLLISGQIWLAAYVAIKPMLSDTVSGGQLAIVADKKAMSDQIDGQIKRLEAEALALPGDWYQKRKALLDNIDKLLADRKQISDEIQASIQAGKSELQSRLDLATVFWIVFFRFALEVGAIVISNSIRQQFFELFNTVENAVEALPTKDEKPLLIQDVGIVQQTQQPKILEFIEQRGRVSWRDLITKKTFGNGETIEAEINKLLDAGLIAKTSNGTKSNTIYERVYQ